MARLSFAELREFIRAEQRFAVKVASILAATLLSGAAVLALAAETSAVARADTITTTTSSVNSATFGMTLPSAALPTGQDEIHSSDGTSCRSAVGGNGAYMDMGVIGAPQNDTTNATAAAYGRVVIPLGQVAHRLDCSQLYALEIERLKMEIQLARMGNAGGGVTPESKNGAWMQEGWNDAPAKTTAVAAANPPKKDPALAGAPLTAVATPAPAAMVNSFGPPPDKNGKKKPIKAAAAPSDPIVTGTLVSAAPPVASSLAMPGTLNLLPPAKMNWKIATQPSIQPVFASSNALY
ncbi:hypothetical protein [Aestuariivirga litoralis]|uniref:hypothetical protein n=1 Tax=Aestuariivirga litoralis TaxID=2650924 RepID=UPI0018C6D64C|nr:hypothetical protein [Aestuariivirga litoralis]MBG1232240.1 hypothetical protein [Aestuariivirga litoralis]